VATPIDPGSPPPTPDYELEALIDRAFRAADPPDRDHMRQVIGEAIVLGRLREHRERDRKHPTPNYGD
jgi:hypothetical protein